VSTPTVMQSYATNPTRRQYSDINGRTLEQRRKMNVTGAR
jgi:hypothetical protein